MLVPWRVFSTKTTPVAVYVLKDTSFVMFQLQPKSETRHRDDEYPETILSSIFQVVSMPFEKYSSRYIISPGRSRNWPFLKPSNFGFCLPSQNHGSVKDVFLFQ